MSKPSVLSVSLAAAAVALVSACSSPQHASTTPGTTPSVWTGSPAPSGSANHEPAAAGQGLSTQLKAPDGTEVATAKFEFNNGFATVTIVTTGGAHLAPGFHGVHLHKVGKCEPGSVAPGGGPAGDFLSAGDHFQAPGHTSQPPSGDLSLLQVRRDGGGTLVTTTDAFALDDLTTGEKTAIIIHAGADNMPNGGMAMTGSEQMPMNTGDASKRVACGVLGAG